MNSLLPRCFANLFECNDIVHDANLRYNRNIKLNQSTTNVSLFLVLNVTDLEAGMTLFISKRDARHVDIFKAKLKQHYLESYI